MQHIVKKQFIEFTLDKGLDHFHLQQLISSQYWAHIVPLLEKTFDKIGNEDEVITLDKLEIDLGVISVKSLEKNDWGARLQAKMETLLFDITHSSSVSKKAVPATKRVSVFKQWFFYMQKGYLPWNTIQTDERWYQLVLEALAVDYESVQLLRDAVQKDDNVLKRVVAQHAAFFLLKLTEIFTAAKQDELAEVIEELQVILLFLRQGANNEMPAAKEIQLELWSKAISFAAEGNFATTKEKLYEQLITLFLHDNSIVKELPVAIVSKLKFTLRHIEKNTTKRKVMQSEEERNRPSKKNKNADAKKLNEKISFDEQNEEELKNGTPSSITEKDVLHNQRMNASQEITERQVEKAITGSIDEEGIVVANAGVVLLHPFLHSLFKHLHLTTDGKFTDKKLHQQSLYIMHYLATGNVEAEEHELVIGKILVGHPLAEAVEKDITISKEIIQEADEMIIAAIQQWDKLTGTSPGGLREGFLQRNGKLTERNGSLYLQVEQSAIDILLDYLPWNLGMIKLPWMKDILRVEWR